MHFNGFIFLDVRSDGFIAQLDELVYPIKCSLFLALFVYVRACVRVTVNRAQDIPGQILWKCPQNLPPPSANIIPDFAGTNPLPGKCHPYTNPPGTFYPKLFPGHAPRKSPRQLPPDTS